MKRATFLSFRDPRERTPAAELPVVTNSGSHLFINDDYFKRSSSRRKFSRSRRF